MRGEVFAAIRSIGQASASAVAESTGLSPEATHFHLKGLLKVDLIEVVGQRATTRRPESIYQSTAKRYNLPKDPELAAIVSKSVTAGLRRSVRGYEKAAALSREADDPSVGFQIIQTKVRLSAQDMETFRAMINQASQFAIERDDDAGATFQWTSIVYPVK